MKARTLWLLLISLATGCVSPHHDEENIREAVRFLNRYPGADTRKFALDQTPPLSIAHRDLREAFMRSVDTNSIERALVTAVTNTFTLTELRAMNQLPNAAYERFWLCGLKLNHCHPIVRFSNCRAIS